jgi:hypothetical protein
MRKAPQTLIQYTQSCPIHSNPLTRTTLKDDVLLTFIAQQVLGCLLVLLVALFLLLLLALCLLRGPGICRFGFSLLGALDLLQPVELFTV